jgi:4'-phosphopantetheinyl transferase EntD
LFRADDFDALSSVLPPGVAFAWASADDRAELLPDEEPFVARAGDKRRREFAGGRACARRALGALGVPEVAIPSGRHREPVWPSGIVGSVTHTSTVCAAAAAKVDAYRAIGIDLEPDVPLEPDVAGRVCDDEELAAADALGVDAGTFAHVLFSAKEALYKCQFPLSTTFLGFRDVALEQGSRPGDFRAILRVAAGPLSIGHRFEGRWLRRGGLILSAVWEQVGGPPRP